MRRMRREDKIHAGKEMEEKDVVRIKEEERRKTKMQRGRTGRAR